MFASLQANACLLKDFRPLQNYWAPIRRILRNEAEPASRGPLRGRGKKWKRRKARRTAQGLCLRPLVNFRRWEPSKEQGCGGNCGKSQAYTPALPAARSGAAGRKGDLPSSHRGAGRTRGLGSEPKLRSGSASPHGARTGTETTSLANNTTARKEKLKNKRTHVSSRKKEKRSIGA